MQEILSAILRACQQHQATKVQWKCREEIPPTQLSMAPPATEQDIQRVERQLGRSIPAGLRETLLTVSSATEINWQLPNKVAPPEPFNFLIWGECCWNLENLSRLQEVYRGWLNSECFDDEEDPDHLVWQNKFPFYELGNGDLLAIDEAERVGHVIYLSHDMEPEPGHGYSLGHSFTDYLVRHGSIGFVGPEGSCWEMFCSSSCSGIDPHGELAHRWRHWFGMEMRLAE